LRFWQAVGIATTSTAETPIEEELSTSEVTAVAATAVAFEVLAAMAGVAPRSRRGRRRSSMETQLQHFLI
jgi:hypothetical protein